MGNYKRRANAINACYEAAKEKGLSIFALQDGGWCAGATGGVGYKKYGSLNPNQCHGGKGGTWANSVYEIGGKINIIKSLLTYLMPLIKAGPKLGIR